MQGSNLRPLPCEGSALPLSQSPYPTLDTLYGPRRSQVKKPIPVELVGEAGRQAAAVEPTDEILSLTERGNGLRQARPGSGSCQKPRRAIARTDVRVRSPRYAARPNVRGRRRQIAA